MFRIKVPFQLQLYICVCVLNERCLIAFKTKKKETQDVVYHCLYGVSHFYAYIPLTRGLLDYFSSVQHELLPGFGGLIESIPS